MYLTRHQSHAGPRWAVDGRFLPAGFDLGVLLCLPQASFIRAIQALLTEGEAEGEILPPIEASQEVWACGVTYRRSRDARLVESSTGDIYDRVYVAPRPEIYLKSIGWRVIGQGTPIRVRRDSQWTVPEPELTLVLNARGEVIGYTAGNDVSARDIEGDNPLYLPQAKIFRASCALGPGIVIAGLEEIRGLDIQMEILRGNREILSEETLIANMKRELSELVEYLFRELDFPQGAFLMTGTGIVPPDDFALRPGDLVRIHVGDLLLENRVSE